MTTVSVEVPQGEPTLVRTHAPSKLPSPLPPRPLFRDARRGSSASGLLRRAGLEGSTARGASREPDSDFSSLPILPPALPDCARAGPGKATIASVADSRAALARYRMTVCMMCWFPIEQGSWRPASPRWCSEICRSRRARQPLRPSPRCLAFTPRPCLPCRRRHATICNASSGQGRCCAFAPSHGARSRTSRSSSLVRMLATRHGNSVPSSVRSTGPDHVDAEISDRENRGTDTSGPLRHRAGMHVNPITSLPDIRKRSWPQFCASM